MADRCKIGEAADRLAVSVRAIRYYEEEGLLVPIRTDGGTRLYDQRRLDRLRAVLDLARGGRSIDSIKALAGTREACATGDESRRSVSAQLDAVLADLDSRIADLNALAHDVRAAKEVVAGCAGCENPPNSQGCPDCPVRAALKEVQLLNLVWDQGE